MNQHKKARLEAEHEKNKQTIASLSDHVKKLKKRNYDIRKELENG